MWLFRNRYTVFSRIVNQLSSTPPVFSKYEAFRAAGVGARPTIGYGKIRTISYGVDAKEKKGFPAAKEFLKLGIQGTSLNENGKILRLVFDGAEKLSFPLVWLRDNCRCENCFDGLSHSRTHDQQLLTADLSVKEISTLQHSLRITWEDGHVSEYTKEWLCHHSFEEEHREERNCRRFFKRVNWTAEDFEELAFFRSFSYSDVLNDDRALLKWLDHLAQYGISILKGAPKNSGQLEKLADRIAFIRKTHYGEQFSVIGSDGANNVAYKKGPLQLHTDLPYYNHLPGIVMLHCIINSAEGGENILSDGLNASMQLSNPMYRVLSETIVDWVDIGNHENKKFYSLNREPVLCLNPSGELEKINWSQPQRDSVFNVTPEKAVEWYGAAIEFSRILHDKRNAVTFKSKPGDILAFDNRRILHGRKDYSDSRRLLYGAYIDWDEIYSRIRVLKNELQTIN